MKLVISFIAALAFIGCATGTDDVGTEPTAGDGTELAGGCHTVCPHCPANKICPAIACYLECNAPTPCGPAKCAAGQVCCNESCGICTEPGGFCTDQYCEPAPSGHKCSVAALCIVGYHWSETQCRCVADKVPTGSSCSTDSDCRTFSNYCDGCGCQALGVSEPDPKCSGTQVQCFVDPCFDSTAVCLGGTCSLASTSTTL